MRYLKRFILFLLILLLIVGSLVVILLYSPTMQTFIAKKAATIYLKKLDNKVVFDDLYIDLSKEIRVEGLYVEDLNKDTLLVASKVAVPIQELSLWNQKVHIGDIHIHQPIVHVVKKEGKEKYNIEDLLESLGIDLAPKPKDEKKEPPTWDIQIGDIVASQADIHFEDQEIKVIVDGIVQRANFNIETNMVYVDTLQAVGTEGKSDVHFDASLPRGNINVQTLIAKGEQVEAAVEVRKHDVEVDAVLTEGQINLKNFDVQGSGGVAEVRLPKQQVVADATIGSVRGNVKTLIFNADDLAADVRLQKQKLRVQATAQTGWIDADTLLVSGQQLTAKVDDQKGRVKIDGTIGAIQGALRPLTFKGSDVDALVNLPKQNIIVDAQTPTLLADAKKLLFEAQDWEADIELTQTNTHIKANAPDIFADVNQLQFAANDLNTLINLKKEGVIIDASLEKAQADMKLQVIDTRGVVAQIDAPTQQISGQISTSELLLNLQQFDLQTTALTVNLKDEKNNLAINSQLDAFQVDLNQLDFGKRQLELEQLVMAGPELYLKNPSTQTGLYINWEQLILEGVQTKDWQNEELLIPQLTILEPYLATEGIANKIDTLFYTPQLQINGGDINLANNKFVINELISTPPKVRLKRDRDTQVYNVQQIVQLFTNSPISSSSKPSIPASSNPPFISLKHIYIPQPDIQIHDEITRKKLFASTSLIDLYFQEMDAANLRFDLESSTIQQLFLSVENDTQKSPQDTLIYVQDIALAPMRLALKEPIQVSGQEVVINQPVINIKKEKNTYNVDSLYNFEYLSQLFTNPATPPSIPTSVPQSFSPSIPPSIALASLQVLQARFSLNDEINQLKINAVSEQLKSIQPQVQLPSQNIGLDQLLVDQLMVQVNNKDQLKVQVELDQLETGKTQVQLQPQNVKLNQLLVDQLAVQVNNKEQLKVQVDLKQLGSGELTVGVQTKDILLDQLLLDQLAVDIETRDIDNQPEEEKTEEWYEQVVYLSPTDWQLKAGSFLAQNAALTLVNKPVTETFTNKEQINFNDLLVQNIQADISDIYYGNNQVKGQVNHLSAQEKSGLYIEKIAGKVTVDTSKTSIENLYLKTPHSQLGNYIALSYPSFRAFSDFIPRVKMEGHFAADSYLKFDDLFYFAPQLKEQTIIQRNANRAIELEGIVLGTVDKLKGKDLKINIGDIAYEGDFKLRGLPDFYNTLITFNVHNFETDLPSIRELIPELHIPENFNKLGNLSFNGRFLGYPQQFVADGILNTDLGAIQSDIKMDFITDSLPSYKGTLKLVDFNLYEWLNKDDRFDKISLNAKVNGKGLTIEDLEAEIDTAFVSVDFKGYSYDSILVKQGFIEGKAFEGEMAINDPNVNLGFKGLVDLRGEVPVYKLKALGVRHLDLAPLNILPKDKFYSDLKLKGVAYLDLKGDNIDNLEGLAQLRGLIVTKDSVSAILKSIDFSSYFDDDQRAASLTFDYGTADFYGDFNYRELIPSVQNFLHTYFPYRFDTVAKTSAQDIHFDIQIKDPIPLTKLFVPGLEQLDSVGLSGNFNTETKEMFLEADVPEFVFEGNRGERLILVATSDEEHIYYDAQIDSVITSSALDIPRVYVKGDVRNDSIDFTIAVAPDSAATRFAIEGLLFANLDSLRMNFTNTEIVINNKAWEASTGSFMYKNKDIFAIENVILSQGDQKISIQSKPSNEFNNETIIKIDQVIVGDFNELDVIENLGLDGTLSGQVFLKDLFQQQIIESAFRVDSLHFLKQKIGNVTAAVAKKKGDQNINIQADLFGNLYNGNGKGTFTLPPEGQSAGILDIDLALDKASLLFLEPFIGEFTSDLAGTGAVNLNLHGLSSAPKLSGNIKINDAQVTIDYLQTTYTTNDTLNAEIEVNNNMLNFVNLQILDKDTNTAVLNGFFDLNDFKDMYLDVDMRTDEFLFLNTTITDNDLFYGTAYGDGGARIYGNLQEINMDIQGRSLPQTEIALLLEDGASDIGDDRIYSFIVRDTSLYNQTDTTASSVGFNINMDLDITEDAQIQIIFDLNAGDIIKSRGKGNLQMQVSTIGDFAFDMYGIYEIVQGEYLFSIQKVINKFFTVKEGGRITFTGDPYKAQLDLSAIYGLRTSRYDIFTEADKNVLSVGGQSSNAEDIARKRTPIDVYLNMSGVLEQPDIKFDIKQRETSLPVVDNLFDTRIAELTNADQNELNKQIFGLLILNRFMPPDDFGIDLRSGVNTTVSEFLSSYLLGYLNDAVSGLIDGAEINFSWSQYDADYIQFGDEFYPNTRSEIGLSYTQRIFEDRISVNIGGNVDVGRQYQSYDNVAIAGDFVVIYDITKDGVYQLKAFNKFDKDLFDGDYNKIGVSFLTSQEFDSFKELFAPKYTKEERRKRRQEKRQQRKTQTNP